VAVAYSVGTGVSLLFKLNTRSFIDRGVDISYLSCFPEEAEHIFPPLTYLQPGKCRSLQVEGHGQFTVVEVTPSFGT
jgi:hypothetical protein